jgi:hypothetical protein
LDSVSEERLRGWIRRVRGWMRWDRGQLWSILRAWLLVVGFDGTSLKIGGLGIWSHPLLWCWKLPVRACFKPC